MRLHRTGFIQISKKKYYSGGKTYQSTYVLRNVKLVGYKQLYSTDRSVLPAVRREKRPFFFKQRPFSGLARLVVQVSKLHSYTTR